MDELLFVGMNIPKETRAILDKILEQACAGMTNAQKWAYEVGVENALSAMAAVCEVDESPILYMPQFEISTEMTLDEVKEYFCKE